MLLYRGAIASGKTIAGAARSIERRVKYPGTVQIIGGPSWDQLRDGTMRTMARLIPPGWITYENKVEHTQRLYNGSEFIFRTLDNPDVLRALEAHDYWVDENALCSGEVLDIGLGRLRLPCDDPTFQHSAWFTTTPRGMDWTLDAWGQDGKEGYEVVHSTIYDNRPNLPLGYIERLEEKYRDTPFFEQELLGLYTAFEGLVYPMFRRESHVREAPRPLSLCDEVVVGIDFGGVVPTAMILLGKSGGRVHVYEEFYKTGAELGEMGARLHAWCQEARLRPDQLRLACDWEQVSIATLNAAGFRAIKADKDRQAGIKYVAETLNRRGLTVDKACPNLIAEFGQYVWSSKRDMATKVVYRTDQPIDHHGDALDGLRYGMMMLAQGVAAPAETVVSGTGRRWRR